MPRDFIHLARHTLISLGAICLGLMLTWHFSGPVTAAEPACQFNLTDARLGLMAAETPHVVLPWNQRDHFVAMLESATGFNFPEITNVLIAQLQGGVFYGLEMGGCLTAPALLATTERVRQSGATPAGVFA